ncbi:MAG: c-type cytochrome [Planctomycetes bacterium]|nr:c-type cytochrome [Planctomycetota bacterium]
MIPKLLRIAVPLLALAGAAAWLLRPSPTPIHPALRGKLLAEANGCFGCHGPEGQGGVADPLAPGGEIPDWSYSTARLFVTSVADVREWIQHGATAAERQRGEGRHRSIAPMPAYGDRLSEREIDDLSAYFLAVSGWRPAYSEPEYQGRQIAIRLGCFGCHGPSGIGGVRDPFRRQGVVPSLLDCDEKRLRSGILHGGRELPIGMPAYHDHLSDAELAQLLAYLKSLQTGGHQEPTANKAKEVIGAIPGRTPGLLVG